MRALVVGLLLVPALARADDDDGLASEVHLTGGVEAETAGAFTSIAFRGQALVGVALGSGNVRPTLAAGFTYADGTMEVDDPRAAAGSVGIGYQGYGPIVQAGLRLRSADGFGARVFASVGYLRAHIAPTQMLPALNGIANDTDGVRGSVGFNWAPALGAAMRADKDSGMLLLALAPQQLELAVERDAGATRWGATFSWGF